MKCATSREKSGVMLFVRKLQLSWNNIGRKLACIVECIGYLVDIRLDATPVSHRRHSL